MGEVGSSHGPILPPSVLQCLVCPYPGASNLAMVELGEVLNWYRMLIQGGPFDLLAGAYKALSKWGGSSGSGIAASSVGSCKDSRVAPMPGYFARYYSSSAVSANLTAFLLAIPSILRVLQCSLICFLHTQLYREIRVSSS